MVWADILKSFSIEMHNTLLQVAYVAGLDLYQNRYLNYTTCGIDTLISTLLIDAMKCIPGMFVKFLIYP